MRRHQFTPLKMFLALGGMMVFMIVCVLASFVWNGGSLNPRINQRPTFYVIENGSEAMRKLEPDYIGYFTDVEDEFDYDALTYQKSELTAEQLEQHLSAANRAVDGLQFTVKVKANSAAPVQNQKRYPWLYQTYMLFAAGPFQLSKRMVRYTGVNHPVWQIEIHDETEGMTIISPRISPGRDGMARFSRYIIPPQYTNSEDSDYLTVQTFGRGLPEKGMKILSVSQSVERPEIIKAVFEIRKRPIEYIENSQLIKIEQFEQISAWIDVDMGYVCRRYLRESKQGSNVWRKDVDIIYSDFRQINHAWTPHVRKVKDANGAVIEDDRIIEVQQIPDTKAFLNEVRQMPTPQSGDLYKGEEAYIRMFQRTPSQN